MDYGTVLTRFYVRFSIYLFTTSLYELFKTSVILKGNVFYF